MKVHQKAEAFAIALQTELPGYEVHFNFLWKAIAKCLGVESKPGVYNKLDSLIGVHEAIERLNDSQDGSYRIVPIAPESRNDIAALIDV